MLLRLNDDTFCRLLVNNFPLTRWPEIAMQSGVMTAYHRIIYRAFFCGLVCERAHKCYIITFTYSNQSAAAAVPTARDTR